MLDLQSIHEGECVGADHVVKHTEWTIALDSLQNRILFQGEYQTTICANIKLLRSCTFRRYMFVAFNQLVHHE